MSESQTHQTLGASDAVVDAVASRAGIDPVDLRPPLYEAIDPDGLDTLVGNASSNMNRSDVVITFDYAGYEVTVESDGSVTVSG
jgi:hypothetical protein